jgi:hypothetical protein
MISSLSRFAVSAFVVAAAFAPGVRQPSGLDSTRVLVSRREVRVFFPAETTHRWGWSRRTGAASSAHYAWTASVEGIDGPRLLTLSVWQTDDAARTFSSLNDVVREGRAQLCSPGMIQQCGDVGLRAAVEGQRVSLTLRDSGTIAQLFGMRPAIVNVYRGRPGTSDTPGNVRVEYVEPQIALPDSAFRADVARRRRQYEASVNTISRWIGAEDEFGESTILVETGDSTSLTVHEMRCRYDACGGSTVGVANSNWAIDDTTIAGLRAASPVTVDGSIVFSSSGPYLHGRRPGPTVLRLRGVHSPSDTMPSRHPVPSTLQREVLVLPALARIEIVPRPDTMRAGESVAFRVRAIDRSGGELTGLPVRWRIQTKAYSEIGVQSSPRSVLFDSTGTQRVVARVGHRIDSPQVVVVRPR